MNDMEERRTSWRPANPVELRTLEAHTEAGAVGGNPTWLAFLAIWLQAMSGLDVHHITRSQPVELFDGWIRFFYKPGQGKHIADRRGFYWGVPSCTTTGYSWAHTFLALYHRRGQTINEGVACMIFRTDTQDRISDEVVKTFASSVVANSCQDQSGTPELTAVVDWKEMLPTISRYFNLSVFNVYASGDEAETGGSRYDDSTSPRHAHVEDFSRVTKLICVHVFAEPTSNNIQTFKEVAVEQWGAMATTAVDQVYIEALSLWPLWSNAKFARSPYPRRLTLGKR